MLRSLFTFVLLGLFSLPSASFAGELAGVTLPDTLDAGGKSLTLNGLGLRKKAIIKVYVAGLYLPAKETSAEKILSADTERGLVMHFVREVEKEKICKAWHDGLKNNSPAKAEALKGQFDTLCGYMVETQDGTEIAFVYVPGKGTTISVDKTVKGTIPGKDFADAMFACWIGPQPPGEGFKLGLLGG